MSAQPVDVLAVLDRVPEIVETASNDLVTMRPSPGGMPVDPDPSIHDGLAAVREARAAVAELVERTERVATTLESPTLVRQSTKNPNAGFIDWRDWCALRSEVLALRAALARCGGGQ